VILIQRENLPTCRFSFELSSLGDPAMLATTCRFEWISLLGLFLTLFLFLIADAQAARMRSHPESLPPSIMQQQKLKAEAISAQYCLS